MQTIIVAGGLGTRLGLADIPKAMVPLSGKPLLHRTVDCFLRQGFRDFIFKVRHRAEVIERYFGDGSRFGCRIEYIRETEAHGTAGGLRFLAHGDDSVFIAYGDLLIDADVRKMLAFHQGSGADATLLVHESQHPEDSDVVEVARDARVTKLIHKPGSSAFGRLTNAGVYVMRRECFSAVPAEGAFDFGTDVLPLLVATGKPIYAYCTGEYVKDVGTPERLRQAEEDIELCRVSGTIDAVFLDRDGTINEEVNLLHRIDDFRLISDAGNAIRTLNELRLPVLVATNQPAVARNLCTEADIRRIHDHMRAELARDGARIDAVYYCPHHPEKHHPDGNPRYRIDCDCRKPKTGMFEMGAAEFDLDLKRCVLIGDSSADAAAAAAAGMRSIVVRTGNGGRDAKYVTPPHYIAGDLREATDLVRTLHRSSIDAVVADASERARLGTGPVIVAVGSDSPDTNRLLAREICAKWRHGTASALPFDAWQNHGLPRVRGTDSELVVLEKTGVAGDPELRSRGGIMVLAESAAPEAIEEAWHHADYILRLGPATVGPDSPPGMAAIASSSRLRSVTRQ